jgi:hypothetical protein
VSASEAELHQDRILCVERSKTLARQLQITRRFATSADQSGRGFTRELRSHVRKANGRDRIHLDPTVIHAGTLAHSDMRSVQIRMLQVISPRRFKFDDHESVSRTVAAFKRTARPSERGPDYDRIMDVSAANMVCCACFRAIFSF